MTTAVQAAVLVTGNVRLPARRTPAFACGPADGAAAAVRLIVPACPAEPDRTGDGLRGSRASFGYRPGR
ncbi:hypothetical protein OH738_35160 [Streptomyces hirsutus]|uniref:Uncharacterized protein n=1 Tax=Streptomyces hirsutus TaxID=35620 RepID=A0ABZ1GIP1_9ACTN|nr:hypothetical protein [Streptomyces hirsutus]WSD05125.1 hypothetical protein OIE73_04720 [Streptomyces hirsutus]WTD21480.1 hypothetical protein OH738_35160 [Streptomyces hirsutus]WTD73607.1 hypothetical protein OHB56_06530 [Streptomyces sp. NBC_01635]